MNSIDNHIDMLKTLILRLLPDLSVDQILMVLHYKECLGFALFLLSIWYVLFYAQTAFLYAISGGFKPPRARNKDEQADIP